MSAEMEARMNNPLNQAVCALGDWIESHEARAADHVHYGCRWEIRGNKVFHVCYEQKKEWEIK